MKEEKISYTKIILLHAIFIVLIGIVIGTSFAYKDPLYEATQDEVPDMQVEDSFWHHFLEYLALLGETYGMIVTIFIVISILPVSESMFYIVVLATTMYSNGILKMLFHDPRPFFDTPDIKALACNTSYGNPSGHSMYFTCVFPMLYYLLIKESVEVRFHPVSSLIS